MRPAESVNEFTGAAPLITWVGQSAAQRLSKERIAAKTLYDGNNNMDGGARFITAGDRDASKPGGCLSLAGSIGPAFRNGPCAVLVHYLLAEGSAIPAG